MIAQFVMRNLGIGSIMADFAQSYIDRGDLFRLQFKSPYQSVTCVSSVTGAVV